ncbi:MAG: hypothetical protein D6696_15390 [Acidobacteria bacterium]|nr:MAG: hypothetical protein D6696_15390 [Acidobacteriota bacterium]
MPILDSITFAYERAAVGLFNDLIFEAQAIFALLATADLAWSLIVWARKGRGALVIDLGTRLFVLGLVFFLMRFYLSTIGQIPAMFVDAAVELTGLGALRPSAVFADGISAGTAYYGASNDLALMWIPAILLRLFAMIMTFIAFFLIALRLIITLVEQHVVLGVGVFFLAFSGSRWTWPIADGYLRYVLHVAIRLFLLVVLIDVGRNLAIQWLVGTGLTSGISLRELMTLVAGPMAYAWVVWNVPTTLANTVTAHVHLPSPYAS